MQITITPENIEKRKISQSASGMVIDELAFAVKQWTSEDLYENNRPYQPKSPYQFDFETDLLENTKTWADLCKVSTVVGTGWSKDDEELHKKSELQAGAWCALTYPETWEALMDAWQKQLEFEQTESPSKEWNKELQKSIDSYKEYQYLEWLNGGRERNNNGVVYEISKYFTENTDGDYDKKKDEYTFSIDNPHELFCNCYEDDCKEYTTEEEVKSRLLDDIKSSSEAIYSNKKVEREKRQAEYQKTKEYKERVAKKEEESRKAKLMALKL